MTDRGVWRPLLPTIALLVANIALACGPWFVRLAESSARVGPIGSAFWRLALAWPVLLVATRASRERLPAQRGVPLGLIMLAGLLFAGDLATWHAGILHTRLANATLLGNVTAILFPIYGFLVARKLPSRRQGLALVLAAGGAVLLVGRSYQLSARNLTGDLLCVFAGLCYTGYFVAIDRVRREVGPLTTLAGAVTAGAPVLLVAALLMNDPIRPHAWAPLVLLACGSQLIGQGLILYAVAEVQPLLVGLMLLVQPVVAAAIGWIAYGERLGALDLAGAAAVGVAVLLVRGSGRRLQADVQGLSA